MALPKIAYVLLWFPKPTETFVFREVVNLRREGARIKVYALYGEITRGLSPEMAAFSPEVHRLRFGFLSSLPGDLKYWWKRDPELCRRLFREVPWRRWGGWEKGGEQLWAFLCGFHLARLLEAEGIGHIHAPWANGPATAAWVASRLTGIPFSFTARAWDIYPPDGALGEKIRDALFIRSETGANITYLAQFPDADQEKMHLTYNGAPLSRREDAPVAMRPPYRLLALGRFVGKKGYGYLLRACRILRDRGVDFRLTLAGSGARERALKFQAWRLGLADRVSFPGFVPHHRVPELFRETDIFVMPSIVHSSGDRDGIPTVLMESLMHRVPVIATDISGIGELVRNGRTGLLIPQRDPEAIAQAVTRMAGDREAALGMAEEGRERVLELFNPEMNHRRVYALYERLM